MDRTLVFSTVGVLTLVGLGFALSLRGKSSQPQALGLSTAVTDPATPTAPERATPAGSAAPAAPSQVALPAARTATSTEAVPTDPLSEADLMAKLRDLQGAAPLLSLQLAREGNQRFPGSADAPERTWHVVKSLSDLGRHDEARDEARKMLGLFPNNRFTSDVVRHTLNHPPSPPSQ